MAKLSPGSPWPLLLMLATGVLTGIAGIGLLALLRLVSRLAWPTASTLAGAFAAASPLHRVSALLIAGAVTTVARLMLRRARASPPGVLVRLWEQAGIIPLGKTLARTVLSVVDVGLGAALGPEGPLKDIGGAIASRLAIGARLGLGDRRLLVACGTAAGMAAAFNVPLGGALFGLEVLLGRMEMELATPMIVCCAVATTASRWVLGNQPFYRIPTYELGGPTLLLQSLVLGAALGVLAALVVKGLRWFTSALEWNARLSPFAPLVALGSLGVASAWLPELLGNGYDVADAALHRELALVPLLALPMLRFVATATCQAARVPGGVFTPMLTIGALLGGLVGEGIAHVWPGTSAGAFALLGMGALFAGTSRGPIASVVLVSELSASYQAILPLVCACGAATLVSRRLERGSLYRLGRRRLPAPKEPPEQPRFPVHPTRNVPELTCAPDLLLELLTTDPRPLFVVDERGRLVGALHPEAARSRLAAERLPRLVIVRDLVERECVRLPVRASYDEAQALFARHDALRFVPVVDDAGILRGEACREELVA